MRTFLVSDQHFCHKNIITYCARPFASADEMNTEIIARHNSIVQEDDTVFFLGDVICGGPVQAEPLLSRLNGSRKVLILGNHDRRNKKWLRNYFDEIYPFLFFENFFGISKVLLSHYPFPTTFQIPQGTELILHGHVHEKWKQINGEDGILRINMAVEVWNYKPIEINEILSLIPKTLD